MKNKEDREDRCTGSYRQAVREIPSITKNDSSQWILIITADNIASIIHKLKNKIQNIIIINSWNKNEDYKII